MKRWIYFGVIGFSIFISIALTPFQKKSIGADTVVSYFKQQVQPFVASAQQLQQAVACIQNNDRSQIQKAKLQLADCRRKYKRIEFFVEYFFESRIRIFNLPPVYEIEEPYMEYQSPVGMQVIESLLFENDVASHKDELTVQAEVIAATAQGLNQFLYGRQIQDGEILESIRLELIRVITLGITGYDAPQLKTGIIEARESMIALQQNIRLYLPASESRSADSVSIYLQRCISMLSQEGSFDSFDRLSFLTEAALPLQGHLARLTNSFGLSIDSHGLLNYNADNLFSKEALGVKVSAENSTGWPLIVLGEKLFFDPILSGNGKRSCATCHKPEKYFTDGLQKSIAFDEKHSVKRNAPSLLYAAYQHGLFLDARSNTLQDQMVSVLKSVDEMNVDERLVLKGMVGSLQYRQLFQSAFPFYKDDSLFTIDKIACAITAYERSLPVMTSAFDKYIQGNKAALSRQQIRGFNLFMGKAQCGTCHFAPVFNGLLPPLYQITELESLGVTRSSNFRKPVADTDSGRYHVFPIDFYVGAFKTPTVRNAARTAPYMHNGALRTLKEVMDFYNKGGGNGLGLNNPHQTLSSQPLHLSKAESGSIISFLHALTDEPVVPLAHLKASG